MGRDITGDRTPKGRDRNTRNFNNGAAMDEANLDRAPFDECKRNHSADIVQQHGNGILGATRYSGPANWLMTETCHTCEGGTRKETFDRLSHGFIA